MQETQILSTRPLLPSDAPAPAARALVFDACHVGVVLRAVLFVEGVLAVGALFGAATAGEWLARVSLLTGGALPATLAWLVTACSLKRLLQRLREPMQYAAGVLLGTLAGLYACGMLALAGAAGEQPPWLASAATGALLSALLVAALVREEPAKAEALLEDLSDLFRHALVEQGEWTTLHEEIALARRYLDIEQVRFGERMRVQWVLDPRAGDARLPPLLLQPLVENAVKHGVEPSAHGVAKLRIATELQAGRVALTITNTVPAPQPHDAPPGAPRGHGIAQANVRDRLRLLHDVDCDFQAGPHKGLYQVRISLPPS
jgi:two-component system sensor histidine kinase AlgZ